MSESIQIYKKWEVMPLKKFEERSTGSLQADGRGLSI
uniref:Uncharacterized protein n=1 Tax=Medicago truncatula TaxID=3880 RepID=B7FG15_MEDTR|nr:unknown [Medicago truncatula]